MYPSCALDILNNSYLWPSNPYCGLIENILTGSHSYRSNDGLVQLTSMSALSDEDVSWPQMVLRVRHASMEAGFTKDHSDKFAGAIGELYNNAIEHSRSAESGYIVFSSTPGRFEFVVGDKGIGILSSLASNPRYSNIQDAGIALEAALTDGVSRFPAVSGRGTGFKPTINGLANIAQELRFRSDDHGRIFVRNSTGVICARTVQKSPISGFLISVSCRLNF